MQTLPAAGSEFAAQPAGQPVVQVEGLHKRYPQGEDEIEVLKGVSFTVNQGEFVALQGTSGSGKSTLLQILGLLDRPSQGRYLLRGQDVSTLDDNALSALRNRMTGFIFQSFYLIPYATALDNVTLPGLYADAPAAALHRKGVELLERVGLGERVHFKPNQLSGGQQQRVAIARSLVNDPALLLADEPTGQLDAATSTEIMELLASIHASGRTIILVTHDEYTASFADRRIHLMDGRIEGQD